MSLADHSPGPALHTGLCSPLRQGRPRLGIGKSSKVQERALAGTEGESGGRSRVEAAESAVTGRAAETPSW